MGCEAPADWDQSTLRDHFKRLRRKNEAGIERALTVSGAEGLVDQREFFDRRVASKDLENYLHLKRGEFAFNRSAMEGYPFGAIKRLDRYDEGVVSSLYIGFALRPESRASSDFFVHLFESRRLNRELSKISSVGARAHGLLNIKPGEFFDVPVLLPPVPEQRKIAAILSSVDDAIAATRKVIEQSKRVKQGLLRTLMTRGIGHTRFKKTEIGEVPETWEVHSLASLAYGEMAELQTGPFGTVLKADEYSEHGVPVISVGEIKVGRVEIRDETPRVGPEVVSRLPKYVLAAGDIVFARKGGVDRSALIRERESGWFLGSDGIRLRLCGDLLPKFASLYLQRPAVQRWLEAHSTGTTMATLSQKVLNRLLIPIPPQDEQVGIVEIFTLVDDVIQGAQENGEVLSRVKTGLMQDLLTGRVRVQPD